MESNRDLGPAYESTKDISKQVPDVAGALNDLDIKALIPLLKSNIVAIHSECVFHPSFPELAHLLNECDALMNSMLELCQASDNLKVELDTMEDGPDKDQEGEPSTNCEAMWQENLQQWSGLESKSRELFAKLVAFAAGLQESSVENITSEEE
ncbi:hypothetical protein OG21DRAFT_1515343 [Imleria badia]|nr:hypothetical protein OG21DRAFT_1515343 [Imleria badia]